MSEAGLECHVRLPRAPPCGVSISAAGEIERVYYLH